MINDLKKDQVNFLQDMNHAQAGELTHQLKSSITELVHRDCHPTHLNVSLNLIGLHLLSSLITLSVCPQFGVRVIGEGHGLMAYFMPLGIVGCFTLCGVFYLSVTAALTKFFMTKGQWRVLQKSYAFYMLGLSLSSLLLFSLIQGIFILNLSMAWMVGAIIGAYLLKWTPWPHRSNLSLV